MTRRLPLRGAARAAFQERSALLLSTLRPDSAVPGTARDVTSELLRTLHDASVNDIWLALAVLSARFPDTATTIDVLRAVRLNGPGAILRAATDQMDSREPARVVVAVGETVVDVYQTARMPRSTGIQRVARQLARSWAARQPVRLVGWRDDQTALVDLTDDEREHLLTDGLTPAGPPPGYRPTVVVPYRGMYLLPELAVGPTLTPRLQAMASFSSCRTGAVGFDCVPLTSAETTSPGTPSHFAGNLAAVGRMDRLAAISASAAGEYRGWRTMTGAAGLTGPDITAVLLTTEATAASEAALARARARLLIADLPMVLVVGTHEPRKNHDAVLHAAELLWRRGLRFNLVFIGSDGWHSESFRTSLGALQRTGRPVESIDGVDEDMLWAAYQLAYFTVFPSLNEGYGLPVAESLAVGTPVVTSGFGSMAEIAAHGGALLVDPRKDGAIADAMARLLEDADLHARLVAEARARPTRTWAEYADDVWTCLTAVDDATADQPASDAPAIPQV